MLSSYCVFRNKLVVSGDPEPLSRFVEHHVDPGFSLKRIIPVDLSAAGYVEDRQKVRFQAWGCSNEIMKLDVDIRKASDTWIEVHFRTTHGTPTPVVEALVRQHPELAAALDYYDTDAETGGIFTVRPSQDNPGHNPEITDRRDALAAQYRWDDEPRRGWSGGRMELVFHNGETVLLPAAANWDDAEAKVLGAGMASNEAIDSGIRGIRNLTNAMTLADWQSMNAGDQAEFLQTTGPKLLDSIDVIDWIARDPEGDALASHVFERKDIDQFPTGFLDRLKSNLQAEAMLLHDPALTNGPAGSLSP